MKLTNEVILKDIEEWFAKRKDIPWSNEDRILLKCQLYIQGLEKETKPLSDGEIERIYFQTEIVWDTEGKFQYLEFARAIEAKLRGDN